MAVATAAVLGGAAIAAGGSVLGGKAAKDAAEELANAPIKIPNDIVSLRHHFSNLLNEALSGGIPGSQGNTFDVNKGLQSGLESSLGLYSSPEFLQAIAQMFDPQAAINQQREAGIPALQDQLNFDRANTRAELGASGNRFSSDFGRLASQQGGQTINRFEADLANQRTGLTGIQASALAGIPSSLIGATAGALPSLTAIPGFEFSQARFPFELALPFSTTGVGGTASASLAPFLGQSGTAAGLSSAGNSLALFPLMQALAGQSGAAPTATDNTGGN